MSAFLLPRIAAVFIFMLFAAACSGSEEAKEEMPASPVTEAISANTFKNDYFGLTVTKPGSWQALTLEQQEQLLGLGGDIASSGNDDLKKLIDATKKNNYPLFAFFMHELGSPVPLNPNIMGIAENIGLMTGAKTGKDYFFHAKKLIAQTGGNYEFSDDYRERVIGGVTFDVLDVNSSFNGVNIEQTYYAARHEGFFITFIETHGAEETDESKAITSQILDSIKLDW